MRLDVLVKPGDTVKAEDPLVSPESDKATMDVPAPCDGVGKAICVKVGDKVSEGAVIMLFEGQAAVAALASSLRHHVQGRRPTNLNRNAHRSNAQAASGDSLTMPWRSRMALTSGPRRASRTARNRCSACG